MEVQLEPLTEEYLLGATQLWNEVVVEGNRFPGELPLSIEEAWGLFTVNATTVCAIADGTVVGLYYLHPNNIGRCGHIANASYATCRNMRGKGIGRLLVEHSLQQAKKEQYRGLQFNAVVKTNDKAIKLYQSLGFQQIGIIPEGFRLDDRYEDTIIFLKQLQ